MAANRGVSNQIQSEQSSLCQHVDCSPAETRTGRRGFKALSFLIFGWCHTSEGCWVKNDNAPDGTADVFRVTVGVIGNPLFPCLFHDCPIIKALSPLPGFCPPVYTDQRTLGPSLRYRLKRSFREKVKWRNAFTTPLSHVTNSVFCSVNLVNVGFGAADCRFISLGIIQPPQKNLIINVRV